MARGQPSQRSSGYGAGSLSARLLGWALAVTLGALSACSRRATPEQPSPAEPSFYEPLRATLALVHRSDGLCYGLLKEALKRPDSAARRALERLKAPLPSGLSSQAELAYWINAYHILMITRVAELWPIASVKGALPGDPYAIFKERRFELAGATRSLDEIEHELIRPRFRDPRVHAALNCASASCPPLAPEPYLPDQLDAQLESAARAFALDPQRQALQGSPLKLSMIFKWYAEDFEPLGGSRAWLARYARDPARARLLDPSTPVQYLSYDWSVNAASVGHCRP